MKYPCFMYISPGKHKCFGTTYNIESVDSDDKALICSEHGYYPTLPLAIAKPKDFDMKEYLGLNNEKPQNTQENEKGEDIPPRDELEKVATEMNISFTDKTKDQTLYNKIQKAIETE